MTTIITNYMTANGLYRPNKIINVKGIILHSVGCPVGDAADWWRRWNRSDYSDALVHGFIDDEKIMIAVPCMETPGKAQKAYHVANDATHNKYLGFEMCEWDGISYTGGANWDLSEKAQVIAYAKKAYKNAVQLFAELCKFHGLNPLEDGVILSHYEAYKRGIASGHADVEHIWKYSDMTMDGFRKDVANAMNGTSVGSGETTESETVGSAKLYRVQTGAFKNKANADHYLKKIEDVGFDAFIKQEDGLYKVQVGAYSNKINAENMLAKIERAGFDSFIDADGTISTPTIAKKTIDEIAKEVIKGLWGNGTARRNALIAAGYDADAVQKRVNQLL